MTPDGTEQALITIVVVDDHAVVREGLVTMLSDSAGMRIVGSAATGEDGLRLIEELQPRLILLDLQLPDMHGLQVLARIMERRPEARVVVLTIHDEAEIANQALSAGAAGYVLKDAGQEEIVFAIRVVAEGGQYVTSRLVKRRPFETAEEAGLPHLSPREIEVLSLLAEGWSNRMIGESLYLSPETVKSHVSAILKKLDASDRAQAVSRALRMGVIT